MAGGWPGNGGAYRVPSIRERRLSAAARTITIPAITCPVACTGVQAPHPGVTPAVFVRFWRWRLLAPFPARAFFADARAGLGPDARARLLLHRFADVLDVLRGVVAIRIDFLLLFRMKEGRPSAAGTIREPDSPPGLPAITPGRPAPWVDLGEAGNLRAGGGLVAQQKTLGSHTGAS